MTRGVEPLEHLWLVRSLPIMLIVEKHVFAVFVSDLCPSPGCIILGVVMAAKSRRLAVALRWGATAFGIPELVALGSEPTLVHPRPPCPRQTYRGRRRAVARAD